MEGCDKLWVILHAPDDPLEVVGVERLSGVLPIASRLAPIGRVIVSAPDPCDRRGDWDPARRRGAPDAERGGERELEILIRSYGCKLIRRPRPRGAPAAILLPFFYAFRCEPASKVLVCPSTLEVTRGDVLEAALAEAVCETPGPDNRGVLLGMKPDGRQTGRLILSSTRRSGSTHGIVSFANVTDADERAFLLERGALINTGIFAAGTSAMLRLYDHAVPGILRSFLVHLRGTHLWSDDAVKDLFRLIPRRRFWKDLLEPSSDLFRVLPMEPCGWVCTDIDGPEQDTAHAKESTTAGNVEARSRAIWPWAPSQTS